MKTIHYTPLILLTMCFVGCTKGLEEKISTLETDKSTFQEKISTLETEKSTFQEKISTLETEKSKLTDANSNLNQKLELANTENKTLLDNLKQAENNLKKSEIEAARLQGKWEALEQKKERAAKEAASKASLIVQLGVTMKTGDTKSVNATKVYLCKESFHAIVGAKRMDWKEGNNNYNSPTEEIWTGENSALDYAVGAQARTMTRQVESKTLYTNSTDFNGRVEFKDIPKGQYYLICKTSLGSSGTVWSKKIQLKKGVNTLTLTQKDAL